MTTNEKYRDNLTAYLLEVATGSGYLKGALLNTPDLDDAWQRYAPSFYPEAVKEFNGYPEYCLACAGYLGMAVAHLWDKDWPKYMDTPYSFFQGERGFDDMDDFITGNILKVRQVQRCRYAFHFCRNLSLPDEIRRRSWHRRGLPFLPYQYRSPVQAGRNYLAQPPGLQV